MINCITKHQVLHVTECLQSILPILSSEVTDGRVLGVQRRMLTAIQCVVVEFMLHRPNSLSWKAFARIELVMMVIMLITSRVFGHSRANDRVRAPAIYSIQFSVQHKCK